MRRDGPRLLRRALIGIVLVVGGASAWSLLRPGGRPRGETPEPGASIAPQATTVGGLLFVRFHEGEREILLKARAMVGQEGSAQRFQGVEVTLPFVSEGAKQTVTISAEDCLYQAEPQKARFKGRVRVRTDDGFELESETLRYVSQPVLEIRSDDPVAFRRGKAGGTARMLHYRDGSGLQLTGDVKLRLEEEAGPPTDVEAASASASREQGFIWFEGGVLVRQGSSQLRAERLQLKMAPDFAAIERAAAIGDADLRIGSAAAPALGGGGEKRLRGRRINIAFRSKGVLEEVSAVNPGSLELLPGAADPPERRRLTTSALRLLFDGQGRLVALDAQGAGPRGPAEQRRTVLVVESGPRAGPVRRVASGSLYATLDPQSGAVNDARFERDVAYEEPGRAVWAEVASVDEKAGLITLSGGEPRLVDEAQGSELRGREIRIDTRARGVSATDNVRHTITRRRGSGPLGGEQPTLIACRSFDYDPATRTAHYRENALLRQGSDEIRAALIRLEEPAPGLRRLVASGGVASVLHPRPDKGAGRPPGARSGGAGRSPAPVEVRSQELVYEERLQRAVYTGDVEVRQGDILTNSPQAEVVLGAEGRAVERVLAGSPVELRQGRRRATGERATYTPHDETLVLVGDQVVLREADRSLSGRILTFQVGSDRIRVDGREEVRSEAVFRRREP